MERKAVHGRSIFFHLWSVFLRGAMVRLVRQKIVLYVLGLDGEVVGAAEIGCQPVDECGMEGAALLLDVALGKAQLSICSEIGFRWDIAG